MSRRRALLSVSDKTGVVAFGRALAEQRWEVLSTGGTARALADGGVPVTEVATVTAHPEMRDGPGKDAPSLPIHSRCWPAADNPGDMAEMVGRGCPIDLVGAISILPRDRSRRPTVTPGLAD